MTTLRQKLVRKKNRKLRRLRELYPDLNVKLFYARDFRALMLKYGKLALHDALSGSSGQVSMPYDQPDAIEAPLPPVVPVIDDPTDAPVAPVAPVAAVVAGSADASLERGAARRRRVAGTGTAASGQRKEGPVASS
jgi:hypothetical protein